MLSLVGLILVAFGLGMRNAGTRHTLTRRSLQLAFFGRVPVMCRRLFPEIRAEFGIPYDKDLY